MDEFWLTPFCIVSMDEQKWTFSRKADVFCWSDEDFESDVSSSLEEFNRSFYDSDQIPMKTTILDKQELIAIRRLSFDLMIYSVHFQHWNSVPKEKQ